ncbi:MAG TPA: EAL domain-containing protein [Actinotalea sp.]
MSGVAARVSLLTGPRAEAVLTWLPWATLGVAGSTAALLPGSGADEPDRWALVVTLPIFFLTLLLRMVVAAVRRPSRRLPLAFLGGAVTLWAAGSATVSAEQTTTVVAFPAPGEVLCFASYVGMAAFLLVDLPRTAAPRKSTVWLDATVVCGAAVCVAAVPLLLPLSHTFPSGGLALLVAVLYPFINLVMSAAVLGQMLVRRRERTAPNWALAAGFLALAIGDSTFLLGHSVGTYSTSLLIDALWGAGFALLVSAASSRADGRPAVPDAVDRPSATLPVAAAGLAVVVLALNPEGSVGWAVKVPALLTLLCAGGRMVVALRDARGAAEALRLSLTDELTGLPNRRALLMDASGRLAGSGPVAVMILDVDAFKDVNDSFGHAEGDRVLVTLGRRLRRTLDRTATIGRLGGDEFAVVLPADDALLLVETAQRLRAALREPLTVEGLDLRIEGSVGIAVRDRADRTPEELLRRADIAMYQAKNLGAGVLLFDPALDGDARHRLSVGESLRQALVRDELVVWYQPQVDARTREVVAVEALVRWQHPTRGLLLPVDFLADARAFGLMPALTESVLRQVVADARRWAAAGLGFRVAMNWAAPELLDPHLIDRLVQTLAAAGVAPDRLIVEVTEDCFLADPHKARETILTLRRHGLQVSVDDYGTGFSSLSYLRDLPIQELKLDRSFIMPVAWDERSRMIVQTTAQMARAFGVRLVAEGVEDCASAVELVPMGVDVFQGYYIARPMAPEAIMGWVIDWRAARAPRHAGVPLTDVVLRRVHQALLADGVVRQFG